MQTYKDIRMTKEIPSKYFEDKTTIPFSQFSGGKISHKTS
jgi:hypothetical protein